MCGPESVIDVLVADGLIDRDNPCISCDFNTNNKSSPTRENVTEECLGCELLIDLYE